MNYKHKKLISIILILLITQVGLIYFWLSKNNTNYIQQVRSKISNEQGQEIKENNIVHNSYHQKLEFYEEAYSGVQNIDVPQDKIYGGIIPHHLLPKDKIATWFEGLENQDYKNIILIGPNHYDSGDSSIIISKGDWDTPYGRLEVNSELANKLAQNILVEIDEEPFYVEHSISGLVPFIKKEFPKAKILPIILKIGTPQENLDVLINQLNSNLDKEDTLVISSVDFSHYQSALVADFHDRLSRGVIEDFNLERLFKLEIDSPESLYVLLSYLQNIKSQKSQLVFHTNSSYLINIAEEPGTSHFGYYFFAGKPSNQNIINMLFFGDLMLDRYVKRALDSYGLDYILEDIAGGENRFFMGSDIVSTNLEGAVTKNGEHYPPELINDFAIDPKYIKNLTENYFFNHFNLANNHTTDQGNPGVLETSEQLKSIETNFSGCPDSVVDTCTTTIINSGNKKIAMLGFSMVYHQFDLNQAIDKIQKSKNQNDITVVQIHWGQEYTHEFNTSQQDIGHALIDAGADLIIGHHPHVVQGIEIYNNKAIFYSLGNFIFDQYFSEDTQEELALGASYNKSLNEFTFNFFPIKSRNDKLSFLNIEEKNIFFDELISWSNIDNKYIEQIKKGYLQIKK